MSWNPDYKAEILRRMRIREQLADPLMKGALWRHYQKNPVAFINDWGMTYDPRLDGSAYIPFILFPKQVEFVEWVYERVESKEPGMVQKSRDMGASWLAVWIAVHFFLFTDVSVGIGSRKEDLVDRRGDMDTLFEKVRFSLRHVPSELKPGLNEKEHLSHMRCINPELGSSIVGEAGSNIGRGGRNKVFFLDEAAFLDNQESVEAALSANTNSAISISTVNSPGDLFYRKCQSDAIPLFTFDWSDDPRKDQAWYDRKKAENEQQGTAHIFAREVDRDPSGARENVVIPGNIARACIDAHIKLGIDPGRGKVAGFDVGVTSDKSAIAKRDGMLLTYVEAWRGGDTDQATHRARRTAHDCSSIIYDVAGLGQGVRGSAKKYGELFKPFNGGSAVMYPDSKDHTGVENKAAHLNLKAQSWMYLRGLFFNTYNALQGREYDPNRLISISSSIEDVNGLILELSQPQYSINTAGKTFIEKQPDGTKSPNRADSVCMAYSPVAQLGYLPNIDEVIVSDADATYMDQLEIMGKAGIGPLADVGRQSGWWSRFGL